jgi:hypothetical protein
VFWIGLAPLVGSVALLVLWGPSKPATVEPR